MSNPAAQRQQEPKSPAPGTDPAGPPQQLKRQAPESKGLLDQIDQAVKEKPQKESFQVKKRRILERCGCL